MQKGLLKSSRKIANYLVFKGTILSDNIRLKNILTYNLV